MISFSPYTKYIKNQKKVQKKFLKKTLIHVIVMVIMYFLLIFYCLATELSLIHLYVSKIAL